MTTNHGDRCWCSAELAPLVAELQAGVTPERAAQITARADEIARRSPNRLALVEDVIPREPELMTGREADRRAGYHYLEGP